jgi:hypothetical protein
MAVGGGAFWIDYDYDRENASNAIVVPVIRTLERS